MKRRLVLAGLALLALWPLGHRALVARFDVDPWKLGGLAMYCAPRARVDVDLWIAVGAALRPLHTARLDEAERRALRRFRARRILLGRLASHEPLAHTVLAGHPEIERLLIEVTRTALDPASARVTVHSRRYDAVREPAS